MFDLIFKAGEKRWMGIYLRILSLFYLYGCIVHCANLLSFGEVSFVQEPLSWQIADISYGVLDAIAVIGLWLKKPWGIACLFLAAISQLVLYVGFPQWFAFNQEQRNLLWDMVIFHCITLSVFFLLLFVEKRLEEQV